MKKDLRNILLECLRHLLRPVVKFCLRRSLSIQDLVEMAKTVFIEIAVEELKKRNKKINTSKLSVMTGLRRREVDRFYKEKPVANDRTSIITKVIGKWSQNNKFSTKKGRARVLTYEGDNSQFSKLVRSISNDIKPGTVLSELERLAAIEKTSRGLKLIIDAYVPKNDPEEGYNLLAMDAEDLALAVEENIFDAPKIPNLHGTTEYDNIPSRHVPALKKWLLFEGSKFHQKVRAHIAKLDKNTNSKGNFRVVFGSFSRISNQDMESR